MARVLLVEDNLGAGESVSLLLDERGHEVLWVKSVKGAQNAFADQRFNVILCDFDLPDGTGLDFLRSVDTYHEKIVTILWSGLERSRELADSGVSVTYFFTKDRLRDVLEVIEEIGK